MCKKHKRAFNAAGRNAKHRDYKMVFSCYFISHVEQKRKKKREREKIWISKGIGGMETGSEDCKGSVSGRRFFTYGKV